MVKVLSIDEIRDFKVVKRLYCHPLKAETISAGEDRIKYGILYRAEEESVILTVAYTAGWIQNATMERWITISLMAPHPHSAEMEAQLGADMIVLIHEGIHKHAEGPWNAAGYVHFTGPWFYVLEKEDTIWYSYRLINTSSSDATAGDLAVWITLLQRGE